MGRSEIILGHLGAEHFCITKALVSGRGFADPFCIGSGPTAWMSPLLAWLTAGLLLISGKSLIFTVTITVILQNISLILCACLVLDLAYEKKLLPLSFWSLVVSLFIYFQGWFEITHDHWLILLCATLLLRQLRYQTDRPTRRQQVWHGITAGLAALCNPVLALAWAAAYIAAAGRKVLLPLAIAASIVSPWIIRNAIVFQQFIPIKSSAPFEMYQSLIIEPKGLTTFEASGHIHPWSSDGKARAEYLALGEAKFLARKNTLFWEFATHHPGIFFDKLHNRFLSATVVYVPFNLGKLHLPISLFLQRLYHPIAFLSFFCLVIWGAWHRKPERIIMVLYLVFLAPYVVVSYYERYAFPLLGIKILLFIYAVDHFRRLHKAHAHRH